MNNTKFINSEALRTIVVDRIRNNPKGKITFAEYMAVALYHPQYGYYNSGTVGIGKKGDFFTAASLGQDFGELLATQMREMWCNLGCPQQFCLVEMGAGNGQLAQDILNYLSSQSDRAFLEALQYIIIEQSPALIARQQELLASFGKINLSWQTWSDLADESIQGCFFSNELVDAFPVHLVTKEQNTLQEVYLSWENNQITEIIDTLSSEKIKQYFQLIEIDLSDRLYPSGYHTEVNLEALTWMETVARKLKQGYVLTIDYGYLADKYYRPSRSQGTLQCYFQHRRHHNPYVNLGYQDITAHVDFTALQRQGELFNLPTLGFTQQGLFLMALGLGDRLNELSSGKYDVAEIFQRRDALHQLIDPMGLGGFGVLIQGKNLSAPQLSLQGLSVPSMF